MSTYYHSSEVISRQVDELGGIQMMPTPSHHQTIFIGNNSNINEKAAYVMPQFTPDAPPLTVVEIHEKQPVQPVENRSNAFVLCCSTLCAFTAQSIFSLLLYSASLALAIPAIIIANDSGSNGDANCMANYAGRLPDYLVWLRIYGWTTIGCICAVMILQLISVLARIAKLEESVAAIEKSRIYFFELWNAYSVVWFVIGAILFFHQVFSWCPSYNTLYKFGLANFCIQCVMITFGIAILRRFRQRRTARN